MDKEALAKQFKSEVSDRSKEVDAEDEYDWLSLTVGWALAKGLSPKEAAAFALYIRYETELG